MSSEFLEWTLSKYPIVDQRVVQVIDLNHLHVELFEETNIFLTLAALGLHKLKTKEAEDVLLC